MNHQGVFHLAAFLLTLTTCVIGEKQAGLYLKDVILNPIKAKLENIASSCSQKVEFDAQAVNAKISSCGELFNTLGEEEIEYPGIQNPPQSDDEAEMVAYMERVKLDSDLHAKYFCKQFASTIQCLEPLKSIVDQCRSPEGIALFSIAEEMCQNDGKIINELTFALQPCARSNRRFGDAVESCEKEAGGLEKYYEPEINPEKIANEFCNIGSVLRRCIGKGVHAAGPSHCSRFAELYETFFEGVRSRASNFEALTQCIR